MQHRDFRTATLLLALLAGVAAAATLNPNIKIKETVMNQHAHGPFDVKLGKLEPYNNGDGAGIARMSLDKRFHGELEATSQGEMLSCGSAKDSGGYVAIERVSGSLHGRLGTFALQHNATMTRGAPALNIIVVPGSGTGELAGLSGRMNIVIAADGAHSYEFEYSFAQ